MAFALQTRALVIGLLLAGLSGCVEPYVPAVVGTPSNYLVVNGYINSQGITTIQLSRSLPLQSTDGPPPETRASVAIQDAGGQRYLLTESPAGTYTSASLNLNPNLSYQLRITTTAGRDYASDLSPVKTAPPIDQVHWRYENEGVQVYVDAHDTGRNTTYYRWKYDETWQFTSAYQSRYRYNSTIKMIEPLREDIYHCWRTAGSTAVVQTNTARLSQDAVIDFPLVFLGPTTDKLRFKYSILVQQLAQSKEEYDYWEALKKNTESIGTINDPLPTQLTGNVHCLSDASESVLGFVGVHSVSEQRIFIARTDVPPLLGIRAQTGNEACIQIREDRCPPREPCLPPGTTGVFDTPYYIPFATSNDSIGAGYLTAHYYYGSTPECVDCRLRGTNVQPSFWK
jgi:hypothetical protein